MERETEQKEKIWEGKRGENKSRAKRQREIAERGRNEPGSLDTPLPGDARRTALQTNCLPSPHCSPPCSEPEEEADRCPPPIQKRPHIEWARDRPVEAGESKNMLGEKWGKHQPAHASLAAKQGVLPTQKKKAPAERFDLPRQQYNSQRALSETGSGEFRDK